MALLLAAKAKTTRICSSFTQGWSIRISLLVMPEASHCRISITAILVPLIQGLPNVFRDQLKCKKNILSPLNDMNFISALFSGFAPPQLNVLKNNLMKSRRKKVEYKKA